MMDGVKESNQHNQTKKKLKLALEKLKECGYELKSEGWDKHEIVKIPNEKSGLWY